MPFPGREPNSLLRYYFYDSFLADLQPILILLGNQEKLSRSLSETDILILLTFPLFVCCLFLIKIFSVLKISGQFVLAAVLPVNSEEESLLLAHEFGFKKPREKTSSIVTSWPFGNYFLKYPNVETLQVTGSALLQCYRNIYPHTSPTDCLSTLTSLMRAVPDTPHVRAHERLQRLVPLPYIIHAAGDPLGSLVTRRTNNKILLMILPVWVTKFLSSKVASGQGNRRALLCQQVPLPCHCRSTEQPGPDLCF